MSTSTNVTLPAPADAARESAGAPPAPVVRESEYPQPPDRVWDALTDPAALADWLMPASGFAPEPGRRFRLHPDPAPERAIECQVTEAEPGRRLAYTWRATPDRPPGRVTWTLTPTERGGTRLRVVHEPVATGPAACAFAVTRRCCWPAGATAHTPMETHITRLTAVLSTGGTK